jgi:hypothetical protein
MGTRGGFAMKEAIGHAINVLLVLAAVTFLIGTFARFIFEDPFLGYQPVTYWRGTMGLLAFAVTLQLMQIRDR